MTKPFQGTDLITLCISFDDLGKGYLINYILRLELKVTNLG